MAQFTVNPQRFDPYKNFKFRLKWDGTIRRRRQQGAARSSAPPRSSSTAKAATPAAAARAPGRTEFEAITLERGVTHDIAFEQWANKVWNYGAGLGTEVSLADFRKDIILEIYNEAGQLVAGLENLSLLGLRVPGAARSGRQRQRDRHLSASSSKTKAGNATTIRSSRPSPASPSRRPDRPARFHSSRCPCPGAPACCAARRHLRRTSPRNRQPDALRPPLPPCSTPGNMALASPPPPCPRVARDGVSRCPVRRADPSQRRSGRRPPPRLARDALRPAPPRRFLLSAVRRKNRMDFAIADLRTAAPAEPPPETLTLSAAGHEVCFACPPPRPRGRCGRARCGVRTHGVARALRARRDRIRGRCRAGKPSRSRSWPQWPKPWAAPTRRRPPRSPCLSRLLAPLDRRLRYGAFLWAEIHAWAQQLLRDVHTLAIAYGWSETEVLALPAARRRAYLDLVQS